MTLKKPILVMACLFVVLPIALTATCPSMVDVTPCTCDDKYSGVTITCHEIGNAELVRVTRNLRGKNVNSFDIVNSTLGFIPHDVFKGFSPSYIKFEHSTLVALTDRSEAFSGLEKHLVGLRIWYCVLKIEWEWSVLRNLKELKTLSIHGTLNLDTIGTDVMKASVPDVEFFTFSDTNITFTDRAFDSYKTIRTLDLSYNKIKKVERAILPNPALELGSFDLSDNLIEQFPEDMFTNMPKLVFLYIGNNKILVLDEKAFSPVWGQLNCFYGPDNAYRCDCLMTWLVWKRSPSRLIGTCASPPLLRGKHLDELESKDLQIMC